MNNLTLSHPTFLIEKQWTTKVENRLVPINNEHVEYFKINHNAVQMEHILFGYKIPYLPALTNSPHLSGANDRERIQELLARQINFIRNLWKWKSTSFSLRYLWSPEEGKVNIYFLVSSYAPIDVGEQSVKKISDDIQVQLKMLEYPFEQMETLEVLNSALNPIPNPAIIEVRQKQDMVKMMQGDAYVVYPYLSSNYSTWFNIFQFLTAQHQPCGLSMFIEPTELHDNEISYFSAAAQYADSLRSQNWQLYTGNYQVNDPIAGIVADHYIDYIKRLINPFLTTVQIFSEDKFLSLNLAQIVATEVSESHTIELAANTDKNLHGAEISVPQGEEIEAARRTFTKLQFSIWGESAAFEHQARLRFLVDANTACSVFRFPIPLRDGVPGIKTKQPLPGYDIGARKLDVSSDEILLGEYMDRGGVSVIPVKYLNRHTLVGGATGSGKTTTCMQIIIELNKRGVPFLIIEPARTEYRTLISTNIDKNLQIFTLGDESLSPFRFNPLALMPGMRVKSHISNLRTCFEAAFPSFPILPSLIEQSLHNLYEQKGWEITERCRSDNHKQMPTLGELFFEILLVAEDRDYSADTKKDIRAATAGRIGTLLRGSKGRMLNCQKTIPFEKLMAQPTILELDALNDDEKSLIMMFLLTGNSRILPDKSYWFVPPTCDFNRRSSPSNEKYSTCC